MGAIEAGNQIYYSGRILEKFRSIGATSESKMVTVEEAQLTQEEINYIWVCLWRESLVEVVLYYPISAPKLEDRIIWEKLKSEDATAEHPMTIEDLGLNEHEQKLLKKAKKRGSVVEIKKYYIPTNK